MTIEALLAARLEKPLPANATALSHILMSAAAQILFLDVPDSAAVDLAVDPRQVRSAHRALFRARQRRAAHAGPRQGDGTACPRLPPRDDAPAWFSDRLEAAYGDDEGTTQILAAPPRSKRRIDFTVKADPDLWAERLGGIVLPTGTVRVEKLSGRRHRSAGLRGGRLVGSGCRRRASRRGCSAMSPDCASPIFAPRPAARPRSWLLGGARVTAVDTSTNRLARLAQNLDRLSLQPRSSRPTPLE